MNPAILSGVLLITALHAFDELVLVVALPAIANDLGSSTWYGLIIASYILASIVGMTWSGKHMDRHGPGSVLKIACCFFGSGLLLACLSQNTLSFLLARILQGIGGGIGWTLAFGLINLLSPADQKPRAVAAMDVAWIVPSLLAPLAGGILVDHVSWRFIFAIQLPLLLLIMYLILPRLDAGRFTDSSHENVSGPDLQAYSGLIDALKIALGFGLILFTLGQRPGLLSCLLIPGALILYRPLTRCMPEGWLQLRSPLSAALFMAMMGFLVFYGMEAYQPLYLIEVRGLSTMHAGLVLTTASLAWMLGSQLTARELLPAFLRRSHAVRMLFGMGLLLSSLLLFSPLLFTGIPVLWAYPVWCVAGLGMGISFNTARATAMAHTPGGQEGFVAGAITLAVSLGLSLSTGIGGAILNQMAYRGASLNTAIIGIWCFALVAGMLTTLLLLRYCLQTPAIDADSPRVTAQSGSHSPAPSADSG